MLTVKCSYIVQPSEGKPETVMYMSECDQIKTVTHAPTVYFYRATNKCFNDNFQTLKVSLSKALDIFYPLAGRLHWIDGGRIELHCNNKGALLIEAESSSSIDDFGDFTPTQDVRNLIPYVDLNTNFNEAPLLLVQLTKFSCGGMSLGLAMSHIIVDGHSALHFVGEWARIARGEEVKSLPFLDRTILRPHDETLPSSLEAIHLELELNSTPLVIGETDNTKQRNKPAKVATLKLSANQVEILKNKANKDPTWNKSTTREFSRFEAIGGHIWRCASKARGHAREQLTRPYISADFRNKIKPPLPKCYFGNAVIRATEITTVTTAGELLDKPLGFACYKIRQVVEKVTDEHIRSYLAQVKTLPDLSNYRNFHTVGCSKGSFNGNPNVEITSWAGLSLFDADFGWGKEIYMGPGTIGFDGKSFIIPCKNEEGSFNVILRLQVEYMENFKRHFYEDILLD